MKARAYERMFNVLELEYLRAMAELTLSDRINNDVQIITGMVR